MTPLPLPSASSPSLILTHPTPLEIHQTHLLSSVEWAGALTKDQYFENEQQLASHLGITHWILTQKDVSQNERLTLASCETIRKRCLVRNAGVEGSDRVKDGVMIGVAGVFCEDRLRGRGYAGRMLKELAMRLRNLGQKKEQEEMGYVGSFLWSDIGPKFYAGLGWNPFPSTHLELLASRYVLDSTAVATRSLVARDVAELCAADEVILRAFMAATSTPKTLLALVPDHQTMLWHHQKEEYICEKLFGKNPVVKGAVVGEVGDRIWAIWTRGLYGAFDDRETGNILYILRLVVENPNSEDSDSQVEQLRTVLQAARYEAKWWNLGRVELWNPDEQVRNLIERAGIEYQAVERRNEGIPSLLWFGDRSGIEEAIEWIASEKYAWC